MSSGLIGCEPSPAEVYDLALLDLDGVVYIGPAAVPGAAEALARVREAGLRTAFVTNNASRTPESVAAHLRELGVEADADDVVTSAQAAAAMLARRLPAGSAVLVVGGEGLYRALEAAGLKPVASMDDEPAAVVQGFHPTVAWPLLAEGSRAVRSGLPWLATNTDLTVPTPYGPAPGNGTLVAAIATATGKRPEVAGKPQPTLFHEAVERYRAQKPLVIGDRLDTDLEGARAAGLDGLLVLTGVHRVAETLAATPDTRPSLIARDLSGLFGPHPEPRPDGDAWRVGGSAVQVGADGLRVVRPGSDGLDLFRAGCAAAWAYADTQPDLAGTRPRGRTDAGSGPLTDPEPLLDALYRLEADGPWGR